MKKYSLERFKENKQNKKRTKITLIIIVAIIVLIFVALYMANRDFRSIIDIYILRKEISEESTNNIIVDTENLSLVHTYDRHVVTYADGNITFYNSFAKKVGNIEITLSKPIADSERNYLALGDYGAQKICLIKSNNLVWQKDIEGKISKICVNKNGYVAVSVTGTTYESIVMVYNPKGELLFSDYLSTYIIAMDISENNKYIALAQIENYGVSQASKVEIISLDLATTDTKNATVNTYQAPINEILTGLQYQEKNNLLCSFDKYILKMTENSAEKIFDISNLTAYIDVKLDNKFIRIDKEQSSVFKSDYRLKINDSRGKEQSYIIEGSLESVTVKDKIIALNLGKEILFLNNNAGLIKKYNSIDEINDIIVSNNIGAIIYNDKISIINL